MKTIQEFNEEKEIIKKLSEKYGFESIYLIGMFYYKNHIASLIDDDYNRLCNMYNINIRKILRELNIPLSINDSNIIHYFIAKNGDKNIFAKFESSGITQFDDYINAELTIIQEYDKLIDLHSYYEIIDRYTNIYYGEKFFELTLLDGKKVSNYKYDIYDNCDKKEIEIEGKLAGYMNEKKHLKPIVSFQDKCIYINGKKIYTDKKDIKNVLILDNDFKGASDFVWTLECLSFIITFGDNTQRLLLIDIDNNPIKKSVSRYFNKLEYKYDFVEKWEYDRIYREWCSEPATGLTFKYNIDNEYGEYVVEQTEEKLLHYKRYFNKK